MPPDDQPLEDISIHCILVSISSHADDDFDDDDDDNDGGDDCDDCCDGDDGDR